jgi:transcription antitermination factor NusG
MDEFKVGNTVQVTGSVMTGNVGTVIWIDEKRERYLVLITPQTQNYFTASELKIYSR